MKSLFLILIFGLACLSITTYTVAQDDKTKKELRFEAFEKVVEMVDKGYFEIVPIWAYPLGMGAVDLRMHVAYLTVDADSSMAKLPYFGRATVSHYENDGGLNFSGLMEDIEVHKREEKTKLVYSYRVNTDRDSFRITIEFGESDNVSVSVISNQRSPINYSGTVSFERPDDEGEE